MSVLSDCSIRSPCGQACLRSLMLNFFEPNLSLSLSRPQAAKPYGPVDDESAASVSHVSCTGQARCLGRRAGECQFQNGWTATVQPKLGRLRSVEGLWCDSCEVSQSEYWLLQARVLAHPKYFMQVLHGTEFWEDGPFFWALASLGLQANCVRMFVASADPTFHRQ